MRRQCVCDSLFECYEHTNLKNIFDKSKQSSGGAQEQFEVSFLNCLIFTKQHNLIAFGRLFVLLKKHDMKARFGVLNSFLGH